MAAKVAVSFVGLLHIWFFLLESFLWTKPIGLKTFRQNAADAEKTKVLALNQGVYNGFLAAGLFWGVISGDLKINVFFLSCVIIAGIVGAATANRKILFIQAAPAAIALFLVIGISSAHAMDWQGHRGARGLYPENTIGAMKVALKYPAVTTLELDVVVSKDNKVIVSHEPWMSEEICLDPNGKKFKGRKHNIYKMTVEEIQKFDCGTLPHKRFPEQQKIKVVKPVLDDLISEIGTHIPFNIEIKSLPEDEKDGFQPDVKTFSDIVISVIQKKLPHDKFTIQSFDWRVLKYIHEKYPEIKLVALMEGKINPEKIIKELGFKPYVFSPYFKDLKKSHVTAFQAMNVKVITWTVNEVKDIKEVLDLGVDGIITDYPNRIPVPSQTAR